MDRAELKAVLLEALQNATDDLPTDLSEETTLQEGLGLDSLDLISMAIDVQVRLKIELHTDEIRTVQTVGDLLTLLEQKMAARNQGAKAAA